MEQNNWRPQSGKAELWAPICAKELAETVFSLSAPTFILEYFALNTVKGGFRMSQFGENYGITTSTPKKWTPFTGN